MARRHWKLAAVVGAYVAATAIALWLVPLIGLLLILGFVGALGWSVFPAVITTTVRGPGYQYRDEDERRPPRGV